MIFRRTVASVLVGMLLMSNVQMAYAADEVAMMHEATSVSTNVDIEAVDKIVASGVDDIGVQLNDLYKEVGKNLNIDYMYVKILHLIAGGKAVYADKRPNILAELTVESMAAPFDIDGAVQLYNQQAPWIVMPDETVERPSKYYLPDAAYSVTSEVVKLMNGRYYADRGEMQEYFDALSKDVKTNVIFCEAVLEYIGAEREAIESFYVTYEKILYEKEANENVLEMNEDGTFSIKEEFKDIFVDNYLGDEDILNVLSIILSFDSKLAASKSVDEVRDAYILPYKVDYTSRENMMLAAMSVVGKVRYVWGGGHLTTGMIDGINPSWQAFYDAYPLDENAEGHARCIQPSGCWCPIHKAVENENGCLLKSETITSVEEYVDTIKEVCDTSKLETDKYKALLEDKVDLEHGVASHRLDGLDCSGYASWLYNQISNKREYDAGARSFISSSGLKVVPYGYKMLPGDVFSWGSHIVVVIGPSSANSKAYVITEASPNMVKFGVMYYGSAKQSDINEAIAIAKEANDLIGGVPATEKTHIYNMDTRGYTTETIDNGTTVIEGDWVYNTETEQWEQGQTIINEPTVKTTRYAEIGRLNTSFLDENIIIPDYNKKIKDMSAKEIIQYTLNNMDKSYVSGFDTYEGKIFDTSKVKEPQADMSTLQKNKVESKRNIENSKDETVVLTDELVKAEDNE